MANAAIMGYGTVGSGVYEALAMNKALVSARTGGIQVTRVLDLRDFPGDPAEGILTKEFDDILNDASVAVVAELMGGVEPAFTFTKKLLASGKSVVTSNKELVAKHGAELLALAAANGVSYLFEASVGGGIPIIRPLVRSLSGEEIVSITGILNGTTNYILTRMTQEGVGYAEVLKDAQALGYAEKDPTADVEGHDAQRKIAILLSLACAKQVDSDEIQTKGISRVTQEDIAYAKKLGGVFKLLAAGRSENGRVSARVAPVMVSQGHPLTTVNDVFNAVFVEGNAVGELMFYGRGAGKLPTASAVVGDIIETAQAMEETRTVKQLWSEEKQAVSSFDMLAEKRLFRVKGAVLPAREGYSAAITGVADGEYAMTAPAMTEKEWQAERTVLLQTAGVEDIFGEYVIL